MHPEATLHVHPKGADVADRRRADLRAAVRAPGSPPPARRRLTPLGLLIARSARGPTARAPALSTQHLRDVCAAQALRRLAREQDVTILTPRPTNGRQGGSLGPPPPPAPVGRESSAGGRGGVPRVCRARAGGMSLYSVVN